MLLIDAAGRALAPILGRAPIPPLVVTRFDLRLPDLPEPLSGFTIAQISDLHVGGGVWEPQHVGEVSRLLHEEAPDVIVNTGDFLVGDPDWEAVADVVPRLTLPAPHWNLAVLGNHDYATGDEAANTLSVRLAGHGVDVLENRATCVPRDGAGVSFVGMTVDAPGFDRAIEALTSVRMPRVVLIHKPNLAERLPFGCADLVLAGHTHGGQIVLPGLRGPTVRAFCGSRYSGGTYRVNGNLMYINRGLGCVGVPVRFRAPPEVTLIRLRR